MLHGAALNVRDFGAKGDGQSDDTAAIQAAFDAQGRPPGASVDFPAGTYCISDTLRMHAPNVRGDSFTNTRIVQSRPEKDIFFVEFAWRGEISELSFEGGAKHLNMRNIRVDQGMMFVLRCSFTRSSDFAIYMERQSEPMHMIIRDCHFNECLQALHTVCDWTTFSDAWITTGYMNDKAAIEFRGAKLLCENVVGVPLVTGQNDRWIDCHGCNLTCRNFRFGGEFGGMTPVVQYSPICRTGAGGGIVLEDCFIAAQGSGRCCAIYCEGIPNTLVIRGCGLTVPAVEISPKIDLDTWFRHVAEGLVNFEFERNSALAAHLDAARALQAAAAGRDTSVAPLAGQFDVQATRDALAEIVARVRALPPSPGPLESHGHAQKTARCDYVDLNLRTATWDCDDWMDSTALRNSEYIAVAEAGDAIVIMRRAPDNEPGAWPHVMIRDVEVDLDRTPWLTWKQKDPGPDPLPAGYHPRDDGNRLDEGVAMPMGYTVSVLDHTSGRLIQLHNAFSPAIFEGHAHDPQKMYEMIHDGSVRQPPSWFEYQARDLREVFGLGPVSGGKRTISVKYYALGQYITGLPGGGFAIPPEYQVVEFLRLEKD